MSLFRYHGSRLRRSSPKQRHSFSTRDGHSLTQRSETASEMQAAKTFLDAGWDFAGESKNGTEDIWWILEGKDYPRLWWEAAKK